MTTQELPTGRELDALIAEKVMGYTLDYEFAETLGAPTVPALRDQHDEWGILPYYSADLNDAWAVATAVQQRLGDAYYWQLVSLRNDQVSALIGHEYVLATRVKPVVRIVAAGPALAICRAALALIEMGVATP